MRPLPPGSAAPAFACPDQHGNVFILEEYRGRNVALVFYPGDGTPVCTRQLCTLRDDWERLRLAGVSLIGVNPGTAASHRRFRDKHRLPFPLLVDTGQCLARLYRANGLWVKRTVYLVDRDGIIRFARRGRPSVDEILAALR